MADSHSICGNSHVRFMLAKLTIIGVEIERHTVLLWKRLRAGSQFMKS